MISFPTLLASFCLHYSAMVCYNLFYHYCLYCYRSQCFYFYLLSAEVVAAGRLTSLRFSLAFLAKFLLIFPKIIFSFAIFISPLDLLSLFPFYYIFNHPNALSFEMALSQRVIWVSFKQVLLNNGDAFIDLTNHLL